MSHPQADGRRRLTVWGWLLLILLVGTGTVAFACIGSYIGLVLAAGEADRQLNQPPPPGAGLAGAGQGAANVVGGMVTLGAGAILGGGIGGLVGLVALVMACRRWVAPRLRRPTDPREGV